MNAIEIKGLSKHFKDFDIEDLSLTVPKGSVVGLIGENGAGKSTTIKLILNLLHKNKGSITVLGKDNQSLTDDVKEKIGVVFDECCFPPALNIRRLQTIMRTAYRQWDDDCFEEYLRKFDLPDTKPIKKLSRGMKMKLSIAAALSHHAELLILDEATSGLDPVVRDDLIDIIIDFTQKDNHSVLISSHIVSDLEKACDYIAFLHKGRLVLFEEKDKLYEQYSVIHCTEQQLSAIPKEAVIGKKSGSFGAEAIVRKEAVPQKIQCYPIDIEKLFIFMVRESE